MRVPKLSLCLLGASVAAFACQAHAGLKKKKPELAGTQPETALRAYVDRVRAIGEGRDPPIVDGDHHRLVWKRAVAEPLHRLAERENREAGALQPPHPRLELLGRDEGAFAERIALA